MQILEILINNNKNFVKGEFATSIGASSGLITLWEKEFFFFEVKNYFTKYILLVDVLKPLKLKCGFGNIYAPNGNIYGG